MATTETLILSDLIDEALAYLYRAQERPRPATLHANMAADATTLQVTAATETQVHITTLLECESELMLVTGVDRTTTPDTFTVSRGYADTTAVAHTAATAPVLINPLFPRREIDRKLREFFATTANTWLPKMESVKSSTTSDTAKWIAMPADCVRVLEVRHWSTNTGKIVHVGNWEMHENLPTADFATGKALAVSAAIFSADELIITYIVPHEWVGTGTEADEITLTFGTRDIPILYAAATTITGRELTRLELDHIEEWNATQAIAQGVPVRYIQQLWNQFYRRIDEAKRLQYVPKHRPYRKMPRSLR